MLKNKRIIVGVNKFTQKKNPESLLRVDGSVGKLQAEKIADVKAKRDNAKVKGYSGCIGRCFAIKMKANLMFRSSWMLFVLMQLKAKSAA